MADERNDDSLQEIAAATSSRRNNNKKKKHGKLTLFFWLVLLALGAATGLHLSGIWDGRPLFWSIVPRIPYVGGKLAKFFQVPERYAMTVNARRALELEEWQRRLDEQERKIAEDDAGREEQYEAMQKSITTYSRDLLLRERKIREREAVLDAENGGGPTASEQEMMNQVARTYQDMSARSAASIVNQLRDNLAVELLMKLPNDVRASIMSKIRPQKASRLTELMSRPRR